MAESQREWEAGEAAARQAAEVAVELSEAGEPRDRRRVAGALAKVTGSVSRAAGRGGDAARRATHGTTGAARHGTDIARRATGPARRTTGAVFKGASAAGRAFSATVGWLTGQVLVMGPRLKIRDQATLRAQFPGQGNDEIAELLIERAARAAAAVGGAVGAWSALPTLPAFPAEIAAETLAVTGIEIKLVAELHEVYGLPATGTAADRARAYTASWAHRRGVYMVPGGLLLVAGSPLAGQVRRRIAARVRRSTLSLAPLFTGAVAGAMINRRETRRLGNQVRDDLRDFHPPS
jgi:hypothetical protein